MAGIAAVAQDSIPSTASAPVPTKASGEKAKKVAYGGPETVVELAPTPVIVGGCATYTAASVGLLGSEKTCRLR